MAKLNLELRASGRWAGSRAALAALAMAFASSAVHAALPEPEHRYYGRVTSSGQAVASVEVSLHRDGCSSELLARSTPGDVPSEPDFYLLTVLLEHPTGAGPTSDGVARVGDRGTLCVTVPDLQGSPQTTALQSLTIGDRGLAIRLDLDLSLPGGGGPGSGDADADGIPNFEDNCALPNADQADANANGIGDPCEAIVNWPVAASLSPIADLTNPDDSNGMGGVDYPFRVTSLEVTNAQYMEFLNAVAGADDPHGLHNPMMASDPRGGIVREGVPGAYRYLVKPNMGDKPVNFVSWVDAASFVNWMENGQPIGSLSAARTGAFNLTVDDPGVNARLRGSGWSLPTENEWYKTAYYDPDRSGAPYWLYPTREDIEPLPALADELGASTNPGSNVANFDSAADWNGQDGNVTSVGSTTSASFYNATDMAGNVAEWLGDDVAPGGQRRVRGGSFQDGISALAATAGSSDILRDPAYEGPDIGFRVLVPEPTRSLLFGAALLVLGALRLRQR